MTLSPLLRVCLPMRHQERCEEQLELEIFFELVLIKKHHLKNPWATSFFEIVLFFVYTECVQPNQNSKLIQVKHLDQVTARAVMLMFFIFNFKPLIISL